MSFKPFTEYSHIVAIKTSGNVYLFDTYILKIINYY
jgi:hypothetical protein